MADVRVDRLRKVFRVPERDASLLAAVRSLTRRAYRRVPAVDGISFEISTGEVVGFLGPNGAGKTTTLKMLSGLLHPTAGNLTVLGHVPYRREREFLRQIALIMGNRNQLQWDIPAADSFELNRAVYRVPRSEFRRSLAELVEMLELGDLIRKPVRNLSLGERMRVEIAASLLHQPRVLFLDEPTLGLDVTMQRRLRGFIADYNRRHAATVLLASHYMADVEALCERVIIIHQGRLRFDGLLRDLADRLATHRRVRVVLSDGTVDLSRYGEVVSRDDGRATLRVPRDRIRETTTRLLADHSVQDLAIEDPPVEEIVDRVFAGYADDPDSAAASR